MAIEFDVDRARADGFSDAEIAEKLTEIQNRDFAQQDGGLFDIRLARQDGISDREIIDHLAPQGDYMRGAGVALKQTPALLKGVVGLFGDQALKWLDSAGLGGQDDGFGGRTSAIGSAIRDVREWGFEGFRDGMQGIQRSDGLARDSLTEVWRRAKEDGDLGSLVDWAQYGLGYMTGQVAETIAVAAAGGVVGGAMSGGAGAAPAAVLAGIGKTEAKGLIKGVIEKAVAKRAAAAAEQYAAKQGIKDASKVVVTDAMKKAATKSVARDIGSVAAMTAQNFAMEAGSIYGEARENVGGGELGADELAKVWAASLFATGVETATDVIGLGAVFKRFGVDKLTDKLPTGRAARAGGAGLAGLVGEGATEGVQTGIERWGAGKEVFSDEGIREIVDSAGLGAIGGGGAGVVFGGLTGEGKKPQKTPPPSPGKIVEAQSVDQAIAEGQAFVSDLAEWHGGEIDSRSQQALSDELSNLGNTSFEKEIEAMGFQAWSEDVRRQAEEDQAYQQRDEAEERQKAFELDQMVEALRDRDVLAAEAATARQEAAQQPPAPPNTAMGQALQRAYEKRSLQSLEASQNAVIEGKPVADMTDREIELARKLTRSDERRQMLDVELARRNPEAGSFQSSTEDVVFSQQQNAQYEPPNIPSKAYTEHAPLKGTIQSPVEIDSLDFVGGSVGPAVTAYQPQSRPAVTQTPEFKKNFPGVVVQGLLKGERTDTGRPIEVSDPSAPLVVYHGTDFDNAGIFEPEAGVSYFSTDPGFASRWAQNRRGTGAGTLASDAEIEASGSAPHVTPAYIFSKKLFDFRNEEHRALLKQEIRNLADPADLEAMEKGIAEGEYGLLEDPEVQEKLINEGFDAFLLREVAGGALNIGVFDNRIIKSATGNRGTWDTTDADINMSARPSAQKATRADFTPGSTRNILQKDGWAMLTAANPDATPLSKQENAKRMIQLKRELKKRGIDFEEAVGRYGPEDEPSILAFTDRDTALELGRQFGQESILTREGFVYSKDGRAEPATSVTELGNLPKEGGYTYIKGTGSAFRVNFEEQAEGRKSNVKRSAAKILRDPVAFMRDHGLKIGSKVRDIGEALNEYVAKNFGAIDRNDRSDSAAREIGAAMADEILEDIALHPDSGIGWYSKNFPRAMKRLAKVYPEMAGREGKPYRDVFTALLAITSNGEEVSANLKMARSIYEDWRAGANIKAVSRRSDALSKNVEALMEVINQFGVKNGIKGLLEEITVKEMNAALRAAGKKVPSGYQAEMVVPRAALLFGPKLGAFFANLMGSHGYLTMDLWWSRTVNRIRGQLLPQPTESQLEWMRERFNLPDASVSDLMDLARPYAESFKRKGYKNGTRLEVRSNNLLKVAKELEEAPFNASDRTFMYKAAAHAQKLLKKQGVDLSMADIQAALWYNEKELYRKLGGREKGGIGYEEAINEVIERESTRPQPPVSGGDAGPIGLDLSITSRAGEERDVLRQDEAGGLEGVQDGEAGEGPAPRGDREGYRKPSRQAVLDRVAEGYSDKIGEDTPVVSFRRGNHPVSVVGIHYGDAANLEELDAQRFGRGTQSAEAGRVAGSPLEKRAYFYAVQEGGAMPKSEGVVKGAHTYRSLLDNIYDFKADPDNLIQKWKELREQPQFKETGANAFNLLEAMVLNAGYDGYLNRTHMGGAVVMLGRNAIPVEYLGNRYADDLSLSERPENKWTPNNDIARAPLRGLPAEMVGRFVDDNPAADVAEAVSRLEKSFRERTKNPGMSIKPAKINPQLQKMFDTMGEIFGVKIVAVVPQNENSDLFDGVHHKRMPGFVFVNAFTQADPMAVVGHEMLHNLRTRRPKLYTWLAANIAEYMNAPEVTRYINEMNEQYGEKGLSKLAFDSGMEEVIADFMGDALADPDFLKLLAQKNPSRFRELLTQMMKFITDFISKMRGKYGNFKSTALFNDLEAARQQLAQALDIYANEDKKDIVPEAGKIRPAPLSLSVAHVSEDDMKHGTAWKAWFRNSKVVDRDAKPLVAYHGRRSDFVSFDTKRDEKYPNPAWLGFLGSWFAAPAQKPAYKYGSDSVDYGDGRISNPQFVANHFTTAVNAMDVADGARKPGLYLDETGDVFLPGANIVPAYLSIQNPVEYESYPDLLNHVEEVGAKKYRAWAESQGHDGIVIRNSYTDGAVDRDDWVAFKPTQVKSLWNRNPNPENEDIAFSVTPETRDAARVREEIWNALPQSVVTAGEKAVAAQEAAADIQGGRGSSTSREENVKLAAETRTARTFAKLVEPYLRDGVTADSLLAWKSRIGRFSDIDLSVAPQDQPDVKRHAWMEDMDEVTVEALRRAGVWHNTKTWKEKLAEWKANWPKRFKQGMFDQFNAIKEISDKGYMLARLTKAADNALEAVLKVGKIYLDDDGAINVDTAETGFLDMMAELNGEHERFISWMVGNRAERLAGEGRENNFSPEHITALKRLNLGRMEDGTLRAERYKAIQKRFDSMNRSVMDIAEKAGLIDGAARQEWEHEFYIPFYRLLEDDGKGNPPPTLTKGLVNQYAFKFLKGGGDVLQDPIQNVLSNWSHLIDASLKNQAAKESITAAERVGAAVEADEDMVKYMAKTMGNSRGAVSFVDEGVRRWFMIEDPLLLDSLRAIGYNGFNGPVMKMMGKFKRWLTLGVTVSPTFRIRNVIRDSLSMIGTNPASYNFMSNIIEGWKLTNRDNAMYAQIMAGGGVMRFGTYLEGDRATHVKHLIEKGIDDKTVLDTQEKVAVALSEMWDWWQDVGDRAENINRAALYQTLRDEKGYSHLAASYAARDVMDFSMQGTWAWVRFLAQTVPFFNARLQGLYKLGRGAAEDPRRFGIVVGATAMASIALMMAYKDDDDWKQREDWDRETYWWFKVGGKAYRIPKPFEIGAIATVVERAFEAAITDDLTGREFAGRVWQIVNENLSMNPIPQFIKPLIELHSNKSFFTGRDIETMGMQNKSPERRFRDSTSAFARVVGQNGFISPVQIDHLVRAYFGWLGTTIVAASDLALRPAIGAPGKAAYRVDEVLVVGDFVRTMPAYQSKYVTSIYDNIRKQDEIWADMRDIARTEGVAAAMDFKRENWDTLKLRGLYKNAKKSLSKINQHIKRVQESKDLSPEQKRESLDALYMRRNAYAKNIEEAARKLR